MQVRLAFLALAFAATPAAAQVHAKHTAAHDSLHAIALTDAQHLALHQLLLGQWRGEWGARADTLQVRFHEEHDMLMVQHAGGMSDFRIRSDTLSWEQPVNGATCVVATPVSGLLAATRVTTPARVTGSITCGDKKSPLSLRKIGS